jgi:hypothetical protein
MKGAVAKIEEIAKAYQTAGQKFTDDFNDAIETWEGDSKNKLKGLIDGDVHNLLYTNIPAFVEGFATLLNENITQMQTADSAIADSIPSTLG